MRVLLLAILLVLASLPAGAQGPTVEDKLRDALRHTTVDLRALQDSQAQLQADRDAAVKQRDLLQQQLSDAQAKLAQAPQAPVAKPPAPEQLTRLHDALDEARRQAATLAANNEKWQAAYRQAASLAQAKDAEARQNALALQSAEKQDQLSHATNAKLAALAGDILHLYRTQDFRGILLRSYEPLLGLDKVKLDNTVQDYEDRIADLRIYPPAQSPR